MGSIYYQGGPEGYDDDFPEDHIGVPRRSAQRRHRDALAEQYERRKREAEEDRFTHSMFQANGGDYPGQTCGCRVCQGYGGSGL